MASHARARRRRTRALFVTAAVLAVLTPFGLWLRTSPLVTVERVTVTGVSGNQAAAIRAALADAARDMTVLDVRHDALLAAVRSYPVVRSLRTRTDFPHGLTIAVNTREPVAAVEAGGRRTAVAADGTLLRGSATDRLATIGVRATPGGERVKDAETLRTIGVLATAPPVLRARVARMYRGPRGLAATIERGPKLFFGGPRRAPAKWAAAALVLADSTSRGARYLDLRIPERPVAGGLRTREAISQPQL